MKMTKKNKEEEKRKGEEKHVEEQHFSLISTRTAENNGSIPSEGLAAWTEKGCQSVSLKTYILLYFIVKSHANSVFYFIMCLYSVYIKMFP